MPLKIFVEDEKLKIKIDGSLTINEVLNMKKELSKLINAKNINFDLSEIQEFDSAGFQLLYTFIRDKRKEGITVIIDGISEIVRNFQETYNLEL
ncbi:MAG: STAS domain-containing protein [Thermodesulfovibrio sp.]|nr:STAS domain-containing protein [Thermodesulfovibrio sp.]MDW7971988.1 STAS domain-containing protein [Thermodesulfovibrio sp.]